MRLGQGNQLLTDSLKETRALKGGGECRVGEGEGSEYSQQQEFGGHEIPGKNIAHLKKQQRYALLPSLDIALLRGPCGSA